MSVARLPAPSRMRLRRWKDAFGGIAPVDDLDRSSRARRRGSSASTKPSANKRGVQRGKRLTADAYRSDRASAMRAPVLPATISAVLPSVTPFGSPPIFDSAGAKRPFTSTMRCVSPAKKYGSSAGVARGLAGRRRESLILQRPQIGETPCLVAACRKAERPRTERKPRGASRQAIRPARKPRDTALFPVSRSSPLRPQRRRAWRSRVSRAR